MAAITIISPHLVCGTSQSTISTVTTPSITFNKEFPFLPSKIDTSSRFSNENPKLAAIDRISISPLACSVNMTLFHFKS